MRVLVDTVPVLSGKRVVVLILSWECISGFGKSTTCLSQLIQIVTVIIGLDESTLGNLTVMDRSLNSRAHDTHLSDYAINCNELVDQVCLQTTRSDVIATEVSIEVNIVHCNFFGELIISRHFLRVSTLSSVVLHSLDGLVELVLEHFNAGERIS